jgi:eukaryotic-like serine/threonine-protein kinase
VDRYTGYCRGCNQAFGAAASDFCPQCGEELTVASEQPTLDLDVTLTLGSTRSSDESSGELGQRLLGRQLGGYRIEQFVGRGGMAWVFRAFHEMLQRPCAIKVLDPALVRRQPAAVNMFVSEARAAASLVHPHVVTVHNVGEQDDQHFIELEYISGQSLQSLRVNQPSLTPTEATGYLLQTCSALAAAHRQGLVHRDFKPANILVREDGVAKLADFGLAKRVAASHLETQGLSGTPYFMAPELFRGASGTPSSDVYAVGVSYYYLLTGSFPFTSRSLVQLEQLHAHADIPDPREVHPEIPEVAVTALRRAMAKRPEDRFRDGDELHDELRQVYTQLRSLESIVTDAVAGMPVRLEQQSGRLAVQVSLGGGRAQTVYVEETQSATWSTGVVRVYSICGPAEESYYRRALQLNAQIPHGSLAIECLDGVDHFVMLNSYLRATCDPLEIRHGILDIARWADDVEQALTGKDRF